ncbi:Pentatricopeptide repeat-containing protein [Dichanthelium oligosanthes]|uniref:Pentatricopeptide repeat-containing protein n=1 Tax=Dichanthelium oligosanthes TaxID=888268 RepID=A0A1E5WFR6_9POAL|nr:Pentatricopeptide repeat-containing protein [Dichanthelium oligosanthes]
MTPPPQTEAMLGGAGLWRPVAAARGGGWATAAALLLVVVSHLTALLVRRRRRGGGRIAQPEAAAVAPAPAFASPGSAASGLEGLVTEDDLRQLVGSLGVGAREPEGEGWEHVISKGNDDVSYRAWCDKPTAGPPKYLSITTYERCSTEQLRDFYMDNEYRMEWDNTVTKHEQLQCDENSGVEVGRTIKKFPLLTPREYILAWRVWEANDKSFYCFIKFPQDLEAAMVASLPASQTTAVTVVPSTQTARTSPCKLPGKKSSRQMIASGLLLVGSIVCLSRGRSNLGAQLAMAFFLKKAFKQERASEGSLTACTETNLGKGSSINRSSYQLKQTQKQQCQYSEEIDLQSQLPLYSVRNKTVHACAPLRRPPGMSDTATAAAALNHWNRLIQLAASSGSYADCLRLYAGSLLPAGLRGDASTFPSLAKSCAALRLPGLGRAVHARAILAGAAVFRDAFVRTSLVDMYAKCARLPDARRLFDETPPSSRTLVAWNCMISAYGRSSQVEEAVAVFNAMRRAEVRPSGSTLVGLLSGCADSVSASNLGVCLYGYSVKSGLDADLLVSNSVLTMFVRGSQLDTARSLFDGVENKSVVTWSAMASGYLQAKDCVKVFDLFSVMRATEQSIDSVVFVNLITAAMLFGNLLVAKGVHALLIKGGFQCQDDLPASLVNLYARCGDILAAKEVFDSVHCKNTVLCTSMLNGYVECGCPDKALETFDAMLCANIEPNKATFLAVLSACASLGSAYLGQKVEEHVIAMGLQSDLQVSTGLVDMYCKCGSIQQARKIFDSVSNRDLAIWSAMINGYACNGEGSKSVALFSEMQSRGVQPDAIVFTHVLTACNHSGLVDEGLRCFHSMTVEYGIKPSIEHYMCMIDLLCKAGHLNSAMKFFREMPVQFRNQVLAPLISAHRAHGVDSSIEFVSEELLNLDSQDSGHCVLISNMLSCLGEWKKARNYRSLIRKQGLVKKPGWSYIELVPNCPLFVQTQIYIL